MCAYLCVYVFIFVCVYLCAYIFVYDEYLKYSKYILLTEGGKGISFLPSDVKSLKNRLNLLLSEFNAGNRATRNEIVAIVDNLVGRRKLTKIEAQHINHYVDNQTQV